MSDMTLLQRAFGVRPQTDPQGNPAGTDSYEQWWAQELARQKQEALMGQVQRQQPYYGQEGYTPGGVGPGGLGSNSFPSGGTKIPPAFGSYFQGWGENAPKQIEPDPDFTPRPNDREPVSLDRYDTPLTPVEERAFQAWKQRYAPNDSGYDYDLRGAFKAGLTPDPKTGHWSDRFKKPNHPTFSDQSQYAVGRDAEKAGRWVGGKFIPPYAAAIKKGMARVHEPPKDFGPEWDRGDVEPYIRGGQFDAIDKELGIPPGTSAVSDFLDTMGPDRDWRRRFDSPEEMLQGYKGWLQQQIDLSKPDRNEKHIDVTRPVVIQAASVRTATQARDVLRQANKNTVVLDGMSDYGFLSDKVIVVPGKEGSAIDPEKVLDSTSPPVLTQAMAVKVLKHLAKVVP